MIFAASEAICNGWSPNAIFSWHPLNSAPYSQKFFWKGWERGNEDDADCRVSKLEHATLLSSVFSLQPSWELSGGLMTCDLG